MMLVPVFSGAHSLLAKTEMHAITGESNKYSTEVYLHCFGDAKEGAVNLGNKKFLRGDIWMNLTKK